MQEFAGVMIQFSEISLSTCELRLVNHLIETQDYC